MCNIKCILKHYVQILILIHIVWNLQSNWYIHRYLICLFEEIASYKQISICLKTGLTTQFDCVFYSQQFVFLFRYCKGVLNRKDDISIDLIDLEQYLILIIVAVLNVFNLVKLRLLKLEPLVAHADPQQLLSLIVLQFHAGINVVSGAIIFDFHQVYPYTIKIITILIVS